MKIVINKCYGGFGLSEAAKAEMGLPPGGYDGNLDRTDPKLIETVEKLGEAANGGFADLEIIEIPDEIEWEIFDYDGIETVRERGHYW